MAKKKQFVTAAAAFAVAASAVAPAITADAATQTVRLSSDYVRSGNLDATLDKEYKGSEIHWYKSSVDMNKLGVFQTAKGFVKGKGIKVEKSVRVLNFAQDIQPSEEIVLEQGVPASGLRIQPVLFADGNLYNKPVSVSGFETDKVGEFEGRFTYANKAYGSVTKTVKYKVVATKVELTEVKSEVMDDVLSVTADVKNLKDGEKVELVIYAGRDMNAALPAVEAEVKDGKLTVKSGKLPAGNHSFILRSGEVKTEVMNFVVEAPMVKEVKAINATQLEVAFNKAIDKSTVISSGNVINANFKVNGVALSGTNAAELSADGKTLTITRGTGTWEGTYMFSTLKDAIKTVQGKEVAEYNHVVSYEDTVAPTLVGTKQVNSSTVNLQFSEPLKTKGTVIAKLADGKDISSYVTSSVVGSNIELGLSNVNVPANQTIYITVVGATDFSDNLLAVNPTTASVVKGNKDGVAPTVASVTPVNAKKFEIKFSEEVQNLAVGDIKVNGVALTAPATLTQDETDKTKYVVSLATAASGLTTISIDALAFTDLSGEDNAAYSKIVNFVADEVAPTLTSTVVKTDANGKEFLHFVFSEDVVKLPTGNVSMNASEVNNFVTTPATLVFAAGDLTAVSGKSNEFTLALDKLKKSGSVDLVQGASYTVDLPGALVEDTAGNDNVAKASAFGFKRGTDVNSSKPELDKSIDSAEGGNLVKDNGILVVSNNTLKVKFSGDIDGASATNVANYQVNGATVKSATLNASNEVTLTLEANSNQYTGVRSVKVAGVKTKAGVVMNDYVTTEYLNENVKPVVTKVALTSVTQDEASTVGVDESATTVALSFSEAVTVGAGTDFELFIAGEKVSGAVITTALASGSSDKVVVTIAGKAVSASDINKGAELRAASTIDIQDAVGNITATDKAVITL
ncbi:hypothetical protein A6395_05075 [Exiguobacterium sp. SH31]|uniref:hypothetical protein n=1 Tax=Exiguobacterium sp. SH31 TaxID=1843183 RepID=UPI0008CE6C0E|nr:hypothetical protein [Exiguobacterium sp. SH31]OGX79716.1 hypothetical protein A6395_05075 [Exiguobacterium sp. SH31]